MKVVAMLLAPFALVALAGCGDQACIEWAASDGACPTQDQATSFMVEACGPIISVDGEGSFSNNLCCYDVTKSSSNQPCTINAEGRAP